MNFTKGFYVAIGMSISLIVSGSVTAQGGNQQKGQFKAIDPQPLKVGDKIGDVSFSLLENGKVRKAKLSDYKGKLVILDFWATWCGACIEAFPKMDTLQAKFKTQMQVLLVNTTSTGDDQEKIKAFLKKRIVRTGKELKLPIVLNETSFDVYFPHNAIPHYAWIDQNNTVVAITSPYEVTENHIQSLLNGSKIGVHTKEDVLNYDRTLPPFVKNNGGNADDFIFRSLFTGYKEGLYGSGQTRNGDNNIIETHYFNTTLSNLLLYAYSDVMIYPRQIFDVSDSLLLEAPNNESRYKHLYCYSVSFPPIDPSKSTIVSKYLREDLKRTFNLTVRTERKKVNAYILTINKEKFSAYTKAIDSTYDLDKLSLKKFFHNQKMETVVLMLNQYYKGMLLDESGIMRNIDIDFPPELDMHNISELSKYLEKQGFVIKQEQRDLDVVIITDKN